MNRGLRIPYIKGAEIRRVLWALVMGPFDSGGSLLWSPVLLYGIQLVCIGVPIRGPILGGLGIYFREMGTPNREPQDLGGHIKVRCLYSYHTPTMFLGFPVWHPLVAPFRYGVV